MLFVDRLLICAVLLTACMVAGGTLVSTTRSVNLDGPFSGDQRPAMAPSIGSVNGGGRHD